MQEFGAAREELYPKIKAQPANAGLYTALAFADVALGRNEEAVKIARGAIEMRPISENAVAGPLVAANAGSVYAWANQPDPAFEQLNVLVKMPSFFVNYGDLKTNPSWDPLRKDPGFDKLLEELAPRD
jgi:tetratricopeptide (TPR) repeat protein